MSFRGSTVTTILWAATAIVFVAVLLLSLVQMPAGMGMESSMSPDCPFMSHVEVICPMSTFDHLAAWKASFSALLPSVVTLVLLVSVAIVALLFIPISLDALRATRSWSNRLQERIYSFSYRPLQELFSSGILHPKLF